MNKDNAKDFLPLVQALIDGKIVQSNIGTIKYPDWVDLSNHNIMFDNTPDYYRIKPEPIELEFWYHEKTGSTFSVRENEKDNDWEREGFRKIKVKEVL